MSKIAKLKCVKLSDGNEEEIQRKRLSAILFCRIVKNSDVNLKTSRTARLRSAFAPTSLVTRLALLCPADRCLHAGTYEPALAIPLKAGSCWLIVAALPSREEDKGEPRPKIAAGQPVFSALYGSAKATADALRSGP